MLKPVASTTRTPMLEIDNSMLQVGSYGEQLAVPVKFPVDTTLPAGETVKFDVIVSQDCTEGQKTGTLTEALTLIGLGELTAPPPGGFTGGLKQYSQIKIPTGTFMVVANTTSPIELHSMSSVELGFPTIGLDASGQAGGPAGGKGGNGGTGIGGQGTPGTGPTPGLTSGAPGGFSTSDPGLNTLGNPNRGSGGAGGNGAVVGNGGDGGGGGGSIAITALGDLKVGAISARGAAGQSAGSGASGGGGSGGVILLRAGGTLTAGNLDVRSAGTGARGRARYDAGGTVTIPTGELGTDHLRGPQIVELPFSTPQPKPVFRAAGKPLSTFKYFFTKQGGGVSTVSSALFDAAGAARVTLSEPLEPGANQLCLITESGTPSSETSNCATIAYLP
jgi:hypothetical protein